MMVFHFLLLLLLLYLSNTIIAAADSGFPPNLSFEQYRSIQTFAGDEDNKLISELTSNGWDEFLLGTWYTNLQLTQQNKSSKTGGLHNNNSGDLLFPTIVCHTDESDRHGVDRYNLIDSVLSKMCNEHENENDYKYFMKKVPIYNRNFNNKNKNDNNEEHTLHGACFFASIGVNLARNVEEEGILITPVAPLLKLRKNISGPSEDHDEESLDKDTISLVVMLAPGIFSSHDEVMEFASNIQQLKDMDENNSFLADCDGKPYQRSSITIGFSDTSYYFFYEFYQQDLKAGITHRCHRLFLEHIVTKPQVISVEKVGKNTISNHHARWTVESSTKDYRPFSDITGLNGKGETVFVADTGLDEQHCYLRDYDGNTVESTTGWDLTDKIDRNLRKVIQYIELDDIPSDRKDSNGHGTHIVASIVGKRLKNGVEVDGLGDGVANGALISFYDGNNVLASDEDGNTLSISVNSILSQFFYFPHIAEAKIISASWNSGEFGEYDDRTRQVDEYFHNDPDDLMLMFNSAGNEGEISTNTNYGTTKYPCISKNVLCVGASLNYHLDMSEIDVVAFFSSYGPTKDGRIKPDIVSPGEGILSANAGFNGCGPESYPESIEYGVNHGGLVFKRGTSMACPIAAGAGALVRQYFADGYYPSGEKGNEKMLITGSLLKAVLINGAVELKRRSKPGGGYVDSEYYDRYQGFGRINLVDSLKLANELSSPDLYVENERVIEKGQTHEYVFNNVCKNNEFRVTLVWRDPPSDSGCAECLVNDLDLEVLYDGMTYYPNGRFNRDGTNNVERVILEISKFTTPTGNTVRVKVKTANFGYGISQKYSLASTGCFYSNEVELSGSDSGSKCEDDEFEYAIDIFTNRKPEETSWILKKQGSSEVIDAVIAGEYEEDVDRLKSFRHKGCITNGCYIFIIKDTAFDGLCCDKGMGSYSIGADDMSPIKGDAFVDRQKIEKFCHYGTDAIEPTSSPTIECNDDEFKYQIDIETDLHPDETRWVLLRKLNGVDEGDFIIDSVPFMTYQKQLESYSHTGCAVIDGNYEFQIIDKRSDGLCCYFESGSYTLSIDNNVVVRGNHFDDAIHVGNLRDPDFVYNKHEFSYSSTLQPTSNPIEMTCSDDEFEYRIRLRTDYEPYWISWEFNYSNGTEIERVEEGDYVVQNYEHNHRGCLPLNNCFEFYIESNYGLCCRLANGGYTIFANNIVVAEGGEGDGIYWSETKSFCYSPSYSLSPSSNPSSNPTIPVCDENEFKYEVIVTTDRTPWKTSWEISYDDGTIIDTIEQGYYTQVNTEHVHKGCLDLDSCVIFTIYDLFGFGLCCQFGNGGYTIMADDGVMAEGGEFSFSDTKTFCFGPSYSFSPSSSDVCETGSNNHQNCGYWASIGLCEDNQVKDWMQENCVKACSNCCMDYYSDSCEFYASIGYCTKTSQYYDITWQEWMQATCRVSCNSCDLDFTPSPTPPPTPVICSDDQFKYEIIIINNDDDDYFQWDIRYKYPEQIDGYVDGFSGEFPPKYEKRFYGCAVYSCFDLFVNRVYLKMYNKDKDILIAQNTEKIEDLRFCHYTQQPTTLPTISASPSNTPLLEAIITLSLEFSTFQSYTEDISEVVQRSVMKILFHAQIDDESIIMDILDSSCEEESKICDIIIQACTDICGEEEEPDFLAFVANAMNEVEINGQLQQNIKATADHMDVGTVESLTKVSIFYNFEYDAWPTTSPTTLPSSTTSTQECNMPSVVQSLFGFISGIFRPVTQAITNTTDPIFDVLFGVESYNSSHITCTDKKFELQLEIMTDGSPDRTSWELLYENGTIIDSIGWDTYSECDTVYNHSYCLDTSCFVFNIFDSFEFKGSYNITAGDTVLTQQDSFMWWKESKRFCYPRCDDNDNMFALQIEFMTDDWPQETSWDLTFDNGTLVDHVEERYYTGRNTVYNHRYCLYDDSRYNVTFHDHIGDGICCSYGSGSFKIKIDDKIVKEGGEFENVKSFSFPLSDDDDEEVSCEDCNSKSLIEIINNAFSGH